MNEQNSVPSTIVRLNEMLRAFEPADRQSARELKNLADLHQRCAEAMFCRLVGEILEFEKRLNCNHEVGARLVSGSDGEVFHVENVRFSNPDLIIFDGTAPGGAPIQLMQHVSQISIKLIAVRTEKPQPTRLGFLAKNLRTTATAS